MKLEEYLRLDFASYLRPLLIKDKCEVCNSIEDLHLHHVYKFSSYLKRALKNLNLEYKEDIKEYESKDLRAIRDCMISKQLRGKYKTLCKECHDKEHSKIRKEKIKKFNDKRINNLKNGLDEKYIGIRLNKKLKEEIKLLYGIKGLNDKKVTWTTVKRDLEMQGYTVKTFKGKNNGTYIFKEGQEIRKDSKREVKRMNKLIEFLEKHEGEKLTKKQKEKLIKLVNSRNPKGELYKAISKIQKQLDIYKVGFTVLSKSNNTLRWWQIEKIITK